MTERTIEILRRIPAGRSQADDGAAACIAHKTEVGNHFDGHEGSSTGGFSRQFVSKSATWWAGVHGNIIWLRQRVGVDMREVQATEAKTRLAELLRVVEHGETIAITRHGKTVAHLVPAAVQDRVHREKAVEQFRQRRAGWKRIAFTTDEILALRHEGHRL